MSSQGSGLAPGGKQAASREAPSLSGTLSVQFSKSRPLGLAILALALAFVFPQLGG